MSTDLRSEILVVVAALTFAGPTVAQEARPSQRGEVTVQETTDDDGNPYAALRASKNRAIKALAERYADLIGTQEWTDAKGLFKARARYVDHDPELKWVKLASTTRQGDDRIVKEVTVPLVRLGRASQSRVRQIDALQKKLDSLSAEEKPEVTFDGFSAGTAGGERGGAVERDSHRNDREPEEDATAANPFQWATSYDSFRANFKLVTDASGKRSLDWGELNELRAMSEPAPGGAGRRGDAGSTGSMLTAEEADRLGEVQWEASSVRAQRMKTGEGMARFSFAPLPRPLKIRFLINKDDIRSWTELPPNQPVRFTGRFERVSPSEIVMRVRLANSAEPGAEPAQPQSDRPRR